MLYVTGDTHGDYERFTSSALKKLKKGDTLFICGDFGFIWDGSKNEEKMLKKIGNHHITGNLYHLMRGQTYDFDGVSVFAMGGGESPDIDIRSDLNSWSGDEIPTEAELTEGAQNLKKLGNKVDIIITHEPPMKIKGFLRLKDKEPVRVTGLNTYFEELGAACEYKHWFFGSMHIDKFISSSHIAVFQHIINAETCEIAK